MTPSLPFPNPRRQTPAYLAHVAQMERDLKIFNIRYEKKNNILYSVGAVSFDFFELEELPDLTQLIVRGSFFVCGNELKTLEGAPQYVQGGFYCQGNGLLSLKGAPKHIRANFDCSDNKLTTLEGGPLSVGYEYQCGSNKLLTSLKGAPTSPLQHFFCRDCLQLEDLEYAPQNFTRSIHSDFGDFKRWSQVPKNVKLSARKRHERFTAELDKGMGLKEPLPVKRLKLNRLGGGKK